MLEFNYYEELKKYSVDTERLRQRINETDAALSKLFCDVIMPFIKVLFYASLHEINLYRKVMEYVSQKQNPYFHKRLEYEKLFSSLCLYGDDCLKDLLSKLDCSDSEFNALYLSIKNKDYAQFKSVLDGSKINTTSITPEYKFAYISVFLDDYMQEVADIEERINAIQDEEQRQSESKNAVKYLIVELNTFFMEFVDNDEAKRKQAQHINDWIDGKIECEGNYPFNDSMYYGFIYWAKNNRHIIYKDTFSRADVKSFLYRSLLFRYYEIKSDYQEYFNSFTLKALKDIVHNADYEDIWKQYGETDKEMKKLYCDILSAAGIDPVEYFKKIKDAYINKTTTNTIEIPAQTAIDINEAVSPSLASNTSEVDQLFGTIKVIIEALPDSMFDKKKGKEVVVELFDKLLLNKFDDDNNANQYDLLNDLSALRGGHHSKYVYNGLNLKAFIEVIGYLIRKKFICAKRADVACAIVSIVPQDVFEKCTGIPKDTVANYIGNGVNSKKEYKKRWTLIDSVLKIK